MPSLAARAARTGGDAGQPVKVARDDGLARRLAGRAHAAGAARGAAGDVHALSGCRGFIREAAITALARAAGRGARIRQLLRGALRAPAAGLSRPVTAAARPLPPRRPACSCCWTCRPRASRATQFVREVLLRRSRSVSVMGGAAFRRRHGPLLACGVCFATAELWATLDARRCQASARSFLRAGPAAPCRAAAAGLPARNGPAAQARRQPAPLGAWRLSRSWLGGCRSGSGDRSPPAARVRELRAG